MRIVLGFMILLLSLAYSPGAQAEYLRTGEVRAEWWPLWAMGYMGRDDLVDAIEMPNGRLMPLPTRWAGVDRYRENRNDNQGTCSVIPSNRDRFYYQGAFVTGNAKRIWFRCIRR
jgi:hypothetical protein